MKKKWTTIVMAMILVFLYFGLVVHAESITDGHRSKPILLASTSTIEHEHYEDWELVWNDEFEGTGDNLNANGIDLDKWSFQNGTGAAYGLDGWGNDEQQSYQEQNAKVEDGKLIISAKKERTHGKPYSSAKLYTKPTYSKTYGKFEARMKLPEGDGLWPAFWMMPTDDVYGGWANSGELDIMEAKGRLIDEVGGTIHYGGNWPNNVYSHGSYHFEEGDDITNYHIYSVEWEPGEIRWYVDGELYHTENNWYSLGENNSDFPAPFNQDFHMILNLAVGGTFDGYRLPDDTELPAQMEVDYVRVYELTGRDYLHPSMKATVTTNVDTTQGNPNNILDGDLQTRWSSGTPMEPGQSLTIDLKNETYFNQLVLDAAASANDYARGYEVYASNDRDNWGDPIASGTGNRSKITVDFPVQTARYIKIVQTSHHQNWWSIAEVGINHAVDVDEPGTDDPGKDGPGPEDPGTEDPGPDDPGTEDPGTEDPETEDPTEDPEEDPGTEDPGTENPETEEPGTEDPETQNPETEKPETQNPETKDPVQKDDQNKEEESKGDKQSGNDQKQEEGLPNTATSTYNLIFIGLVVILFGGIVYMNHKRKIKTN
ncbi:family 16 glycosylhydrolase [Aquibacillus koreensis]|uniref:Family 16 glycosylhydrolase n=1 Tax=Aquibacillus koreensis TaxID=279446 RepID=A0A9X3WHN5_9BACI|nr:family 16 glycosylhydrolase [Aquibacillus koreensis]MCT2537075.1 family 16 glycosylhydrolase [Aquibacillus koreensis]MDC3419942.1 family 16 glycosylhydrolase [Aquibacillus koreensis]